MSPRFAPVSCFALSLVVIVACSPEADLGKDSRASKLDELPGATFTFKVDRIWKYASGTSVVFPSDPIPESEYQSIPAEARYIVTFDDDPSTVALTPTGTVDAGDQAFTGKRASYSDSSWEYELSPAFAGARFVVQLQTEGLRAELTIYGSGVPIISGLRGYLSRTTSLGVDAAAPVDASADRTTACTPGMDQTCNNDPLVSALWGTCQSNGTCTCNSGFTVSATTGRCIPEKDAAASDGPLVRTYACTTSDDCCVMLDKCGSALWLVTKSQQAELQAYFNTVSVLTCTSCAPPQVQVSCEGGTCVGSLTGSYGGPLAATHCGLVATDGAAAKLSSQALAAPPQTEFGCN